MNLKQSRKKIESMKEKQLGYNEAEKGLSIIVPVYDGKNYIKRCLQNLENQKIEDAKFEVILVFNGKFQDDIEFIYEKSDIYNSLDITVLINDNLGAGAARNLGVKFAKYSHISFLDIDDYFSDKFIQTNYDYLISDGITLSQIYDVTEKGFIEDNIINLEILENANNSALEYNDINKILTITVCKAIPKNFFNNLTFREHLKSGEDTVFFTEMLINLRPKIKIIPLEEKAIYYREIRENSVSRKVGSYEFLISQRLDILEILDPILNYVGNIDLKRLLSSKYRAQISFMNRYLKENPTEHSYILNVIKSYQLKHFSYKILNRELSNTLVLSYCFAPFNDTSAIIVMKRILEEQKVVDVVSNNMSPIRNKDLSLKKIIEPYISQSKISNGKPSFSSLYYLSKYIDDSFEFFCKNIDRYKNIYSRAMFPISHIPPLFMKLANPDIFWKAEFSDPLLKDIESEVRFSEIKNENLIKYLKSGILGEYTDYVNNNLFNLAEIIPFALADELIFTNENQLEFMIQRFSESIQSKIIKKSKISNHPTLNDKYYTVEISNYQLEKEFINIAYFGNFYSRRDVKEIIAVKEKLEAENGNIYKFHVFTNTKLLNELQKEILNKNNVVLNEYVPYFEFLNLTNNFDVLLVFDSETKDIKTINPYLPSKISDYLGSESIILAIVEEGSILSKREHEKLYKLEIDDIQHSHLDISSFIENIIQENKKSFKVLNNKIIFSKEYYDLAIDDSLHLAKEKDGWEVRPNKSPILFNKNYEVEFKNTSNINLSLSVKSAYSQKDIISVESNIGGLEKKDCITEFNVIKNYSIPPNEVAIFKLKYNKEYKKPSFLHAGKLKFTVLK